MFKKYTSYNFHYIKGFRLNEEFELENKVHDIDGVDIVVLTSLNYTFYIYIATLYQDDCDIIEKQLIKILDSFVNTEEKEVTISIEDQIKNAILNEDFETVIKLQKQLES